MARSTERPARRRATSPTRRTTLKSCALCQDKVQWVDYKNIAMLRRYMSERGKIRARQVTGNCAQHQGEISVAIKTARELVLLPYAQRTVTPRPDGRERGRAPGASAHGDGLGPGPTVSSTTVSCPDGPTAGSVPAPRNITIKTALSEPLEMAGATRGGRS